jgi:peroxiredoxin Q/BCP
MAYKINVGDHIPNFKAIDFNGYEYTAEDMAGGPVVLYFYPKDETPGCTKEACSFRDSLERLEELDALVVGVSPDSPTSHRTFIENHDLNFPLLCDEKLDLSRKFDVIREQDVGGKKNQTFERTTFLIDADGIVRWIERPVNVEGHVDRVLEALKTQFN